MKLTPCPNTEALIAQAFEKSLLISGARAAEIIGADPRPLVAAGALRAVRFGRTYRYTESALFQWLNPSPLGRGGERAALALRMSRGIRRSIVPNGRHWSDLLGYDVDDLARHLTKQFTTGMTWENMALWHIDHVRPLSSFTIEGHDCPQFKAAWALDNLQPLWARANLVKGARWTP